MRHFGSFGPPAPPINVALVGRNFDYGKYSDSTNIALGGRGTHQSHEFLQMIV